MLKHLIAAFVLALTFVAEPVLACMPTTLPPERIKQAEIVVIGRITNYSSAVVSARFDIHVDQVLKGNPPKRLAVGWDLLTFEAPRTLKPGRYFIALHKSKDMPVGLKDLSWKVLTPACTGGYLFPVDSPQAKEARRFVKF